MGENKQREVKLLRGLYKKEIGKSILNSDNILSDTVLKSASVRPPVKREICTKSKRLRCSDGNGSNTFCTEKCRSPAPGGNPAGEISNP